ncbi:deoxyribonuclease V [Vibrio quintilis]|uniref:Endonuclease V n=1 Tax=Vibrio quintilis TaxID=1117707 RepID=A0A1M7Z1Y6_9VIBR|nr:deoxyribonuclease V [Vibrio quintilis]SHO58977.1 Endonuclease V [Vibrio quintilis]
MEPVVNHKWDLTESQALSLQTELASQVLKEDIFSQINTVAGVDVAYAKEGKQLIAAVVVLEADTLNVLEKVVIQDQEQFPYIPGLFSFRELPPLIKSFAKLQHTPDLIVCDGQGYAHPRRFGLACHLGVLFDVPTIGCGKTKLIGSYQELDLTRGSKTPLIEHDETIGAALRTQTGINPIYVSVGHRICLKTACEWILKLAPKYRLPETTRQADQLVNSAIKNLQKPHRQDLKN